MLKSGISEFFDGYWKKDNEYVIRCIYCGDHPTHTHLHLNVELGVGHCFHCGHSVSFFQLFRDAGLRYTDYDSSFVPTKHAEPDAIDISLFKPIFGSLNAIDRLAFRYLTTRGFGKKEIDLYNLRYADFGRFHGRIIIPIVEDGVAVSFTARSILSSISPKYMNPHSGETEQTATTSLFGYDFAKECEEVVIVEGAFDAMAVNSVFWETGRRAVALSTNHISKEQVRKILILQKPVLVMLDSNAYKEALSVASIFSRYDVSVRLSMIDGGDPCSLKDLIQAAPVRKFEWDANKLEDFR